MLHDRRDGKGVEVKDALRAAVISLVLAVTLVVILTELFHL